MKQDRGVMWRNLMYVLLLAPQTPVPPIMLTRYVLLFAQLLAPYCLDLWRNRLLLSLVDAVAVTDNNAAVI
jgi:hypothetical protein